VELEETSIVRQNLGKQVSAATDTQATIDELLERGFLFGPCKVVIKKSSVENSESPRVKVASNISTIAL
jgi:hypothetical protein